jgi:hypothetical protein
MTLERLDFEFVRIFLPILHFRTNVRPQLRTPTSERSGRRGAAQGEREAPAFPGNAIGPHLVAVVLNDAQDIRSSVFTAALVSAHPRPDNCNFIFREHPTDDSDEIESWLFGCGKSNYAKLLADK